MHALIGALLCPFSSLGLFVGRKYNEYQHCAIVLPQYMIALDSWLN